MADLYGASVAASSPSLSPPPPPPAANFLAESSEDISSLLHTLFHNSSTPHAPPPAGSTAAEEVRGRFFGSPEFSVSSVPEGSCSGVNLPFAASNLFSSAIGSMERIGEVDCKGEEHETSEAPSNFASKRSSSKRARAAEVHNLSEKRRRQRINEKLKALQKLIPNSNKTDKASMLDEAIEYLKQLQLQVQMLTMRNSANLHPTCLPGLTQPLQPTHITRSQDERNGLASTSRGTGSFSTHLGISVQAAFDLHNRYASSDQKFPMVNMSENSSSEYPFVMESSINTNFGAFNPSLASKEPCKDTMLPELQLDMSHCVQSSSSGVST